MKKLLVIGIVGIFLMGCFQWAVWLKDEKEYSGNISVPTMKTSTDRTMIYDCRHNFCSVGISVWLKVINPLNNSIEPKIKCRYYVDSRYQEGFDRGIKKFKISSGHSRRLLVDNSVLVENGKKHQLGVHCDMIWSLKKMRRDETQIITITLIPEEEKNVQANHYDGSSGYRP